MDSMIHGWYPFLGAQLRISVLQQSHFELGGGAIQVMMLELLGVVQLHDPRWCDKVIIVTFLR